MKRFAKIAFIVNLSCQMIRQKTEILLCTKPIKAPICDLCRLWH